MSTTDERPTKLCPDCAETVLKAARKCRFCGFRFDGAQAPQESPWRSILGFGRGSGPTSVPAVLAGWGLELEDDERVDAFVMAEVDGAGGFLALTSTRFLFFDGNGKATALAQERPLSELRHVELVRSGLRRRLRIDWERSETLVGDLGRSRLQELHDRLRAHARA